jgi:hypothetical protein
MKRLLLVATAIALGGCSWSSPIRRDVVDYTDVLETTTNQLLLINILQARDNAPLHFAAIPGIHGSLAATASLDGTANFPLGKNGQGPALGAFWEDSIAPSISVSNSPSFEVDSVESKDFVTGISSPIDAKFIKYWVDRGLDKRLILLLFFSSARITEKVYDSDNGEYRWIAKKDCTEIIKDGHTILRCVDFPPSPDNEIDINPTPKKCSITDKYQEKACKLSVKETLSITVFNDPRRAANQLLQCWKQENHDNDRDYYTTKVSDKGSVTGFPLTTCHARTQFEHYLTLVDAIRKGVTANEYTERKTLSAAFSLDFSKDLKQLAKLDPKTFSLEYQKAGNKGQYILYSASDSKNIELCFNQLPTTSTSSNNSDSEDACAKSVVTKPATDPKDNDPPAINVDPSFNIDPPFGFDPPFNFDPPLEAADLETSSSGICQKDPDMTKDALLDSKNTNPDYCTIYDRFLCYADASSVSPGKKPASADSPVSAKGDGTPMHKDEKKSGTADKLAVCGNWPKKTFSIQFNVRSVAEMVRFLGDLLYYQETLQKPDAYHNIPVTIGYDYEGLHNEGLPENVQPKYIKNGGNGDCDLRDGGCLFQVDEGNDPARIRVKYHGKSYAVAKQDPKYHSLEVLSVVNQLINLNKSATDLRTTPTVEVVP